MSAFLTSLYVFAMNMTVTIDCDGTHDRHTPDLASMSRLDGAFCSHTVFVWGRHVR